MSNEPACAGPLLLGVIDAAEWINVSKSYLDKLRVTGGGPAFCKIGRRVGYRTRDLQAWVESRLQSSTSETIQ